MNLFDSINDSINQIIRKIKYPINFFNNEVTDIKLSNENIKRYRFQKLTKDFFSISFKNRDDSFKYLFYILMLILLFVIPIWGIHSGISESEITAQQQAEALYNYLANGEGNITAIPYATNHPQIIDFLCYCFTKWFHIDSIYHFRHLVGSLFSWMIILLLGFFLMNLLNWRAAFYGAVFTFASPIFLGQSFGNLTDIPFAFFYLLCIYHIYTLMGEFPIIKWKRLLMITLSILAATFIHSGGFVLLHYLFLFTILIFIVRNPIKKVFTKKYAKNIAFLIAIVTAIFAIVYFFNLLLPPFSFHRIGVNPPNAIEHSTLHQRIINFLWDGQIVSSDTLTLKFILHKLQITLPLVIIIGIFLHILFVKTIVKNTHIISELLLILALLYPIISIQGEAHNLYDGYSIYLMIYPLIIIYATVGYEGVLQKIDDRYTNIVIIGTMSLLVIMPLRHNILYHNAIDTYLNEISGGLHNNQGKFALDPNESCNHKACKWLITHAPEKIYVDTNGVLIPYIVATNGNAGCDYFFRHKDDQFKIYHTEWNSIDSTLLWDYYISFIDKASEKEIIDRMLPQDSIIYQIKVERQPIAFIIQRNYLLDTLTFTDSIPIQDTIVPIK